jgi:hypothetical protein
MYQHFLNNRVSGGTYMKFTVGSVINEPLHFSLPNVLSSLQVIHSSQ